MTHIDAPWRPASPPNRVALWHGLAWATALVCAGPAVAAAQTEVPTVTLHGEVRVRSELDARTSDTGVDHATLLRTRLGAHASVNPTVSAFIQLSDSRVFGEETNTLTDASADHFDLHQAYVDWAPLEALRLRAGRQELAFADERLIGPVGWANVTRSFDGLLVTWRRGAWAVDAFGAQLRERDAVSPAGLDPRQNEGAGLDRTLYGVWAASPRADLFAIVDRNATEGAITEIDRVTLGGYARPTIGRVRATGTFAWQWGRQTGATGARQDVGAYLVSVAGAYSLGGRWRPELLARVDLLSGDRTPDGGTYSAFHTLYATNHPFYGFMDLFLNIPQQTGALGFVDALLRGSAQMSDWNLQADLHHFWLPRRTPDDRRAIGFELDLTAARPIAAGFTVQAGYSLFSPSAAARVAPVSLGGDVLHWAYLQGTVGF